MEFIKTGLKTTTLTARSNQLYLHMTTPRHFRRWGGVSAHTRKKYLHMTKSNFLQSRIQNHVEHQMKCLAKIASSFKPLTIFAKQFFLDVLTGL